MTSTHFNSPHCTSRHHKSPTSHLTSLLINALRCYNHCTAFSELDFCIWNANSQSFGRAKSQPKMASHGGKVCSSVSVVFAVLYVSSSPLQVYTTLIYSFCLVRLRKHSQPSEKCSEEILLDQQCGLRSVLNCLKMVN